MRAGGAGGCRETALWGRVGDDRTVLLAAGCSGLHRAETAQQSLSS